jgi:hypothetical protein
LLPLPGEEAPPEDFLFYFSMDIWGDATHDSLYLAILRSHTVDATSSSTDSIREVLIYNLNDMNDVREIFLTAQNAGEWDCPDPSVAPFPQFVPTCYPKVQSVRFNPSGTRLYMGDHLLNLQGERWDASLRIEIDRVDANGDDMALADWTFSSPAIVYAGDGPDVHNVHPRPGINPSERPSPEVIVSGGQFLNSDQCSAVYAPYADGTSEAPYDLWMQCIDYQFFHIGGNGDSWQTPGTLLTTHNVGQKRQKNIYRSYVTGGLAGTEELLIENACCVDTGL